MSMSILCAQAPYCDTLKVISRANEHHVLAFRSPEPAAIVIRTVDLTPPVFTGGTPRVRNTRASAFDLVVQQNKGGRVFYVVVQQVMSWFSMHHCFS